MKKIQLREIDNLKTKDIILMSVSASQQGMGLEDMRRRIRIMDALDKANGVLELEDADHAVLAGLMNQPIWMRADKALLSIIDSVITPEA